MEPCPATPLLQLTSSDHDGTPAETGPIQVYTSPEEGAEEAKKEEERVLSAMVKRKVVQWKEMEMGELCDTCGLGAVLKTMADSEINPIVTDGKLRRNMHCVAPNS